MKKQQIILSSCEEDAAGFLPGSTDIRVFEMPHEAKNHVLETVKAADPGAEPVPVSGDAGQMWTGESGHFSYAAGGRTFHFTFRKILPEYAVSSDELYSTLEHFCNLGGAARKTEEVAARVRSEMHHAIHPELWRLVKSLISALAGTKPDERNRVAWRQALMTDRFIADGFRQA